MMRFLAAVALAVALLPAPARALTVTDQAGRQITLPAAPAGMATSTRLSE